MDKNPSAHVGDTGSIPSPGRCHVLLSSEARVPQLLSPCSRARETQLRRPMCLQPVSGHSEATTMRSPCTAARARPRRAAKTQHSQNRNA